MICSYEDWSSIFQPVHRHRQVKSFQTNRVEILGFSRNQPYFQQIVVWIPSLPLGIPVFPLLATARLYLLFLDRNAEQDPGASGRRRFTMEGEIPV